MKKATLEGALALQISFLGREKQFQGPKAIQKEFNKKTPFWEVSKTNSFLELVVIDAECNSFRKGYHNLHKPF